jgi:hypothetical protein
MFSNTLNPGNCGTVELREIWAFCRALVGEGVSEDDRRLHGGLLEMIRGRGG